MDWQQILLIVAIMLTMLLFIIFMIFSKRILNVRKTMTKHSEITFSISEFILLLGGIDNIDSSNATLTNLRVKVVDLEMIEWDRLKKLVKLEDVPVYQNALIFKIGNSSLKANEELLKAKQQAKKSKE